jgi:hypothetical protein
VIFLLAFLLPALFWDKGPETAEQLKQAGITKVMVPSSLESAWKGVSGFSARSADPQTAVKLMTPGVKYRMNEAAATRSPWLDSNGWRMIQQPSANFYYEAAGPAAALAAAEAYMYGADAMVSTDAAGLEAFGKMLAFLRETNIAKLPPVADIGFVDDGSPQAGEAMNLMVRRNLLFRLVKEPDPRLGLHVELGSAKFPKATNPSDVVQQIRFELTDEKRSLRIYGSEVVVGRLTGDGKRAQVQLLNYAAGSRPVNGLRVRVAGRYPKHELKVFGVPDAAIVDFEATTEATEFTVRELRSYAVIDLAR